MTHHTQSELLPCPFCGDHAETDYIPDRHSYAIECYSIGCAARVIKETAEDAIAAWNRRQPVERAPLDYHTISMVHLQIGAAGQFDVTERVVRWTERAHGITQEKQG